MRIFIAYEGERYVYDVDDGAKVEDVRKEVQERFMIGGDQAGKPDRKVVVLSFAGADLKDEWVFTDIGINPGTTIRIKEKEEIKPRLFVHCSHKNDVIQVMDEIDIVHSSVADLRSIVSRRSGLPVGVFRLVDDKSEKELFDCHNLEDYNFSIGDKVLLETWDGWTDFLNLAIRGFAHLVMEQLFPDEAISRFQMKVALYIAAHFGHPDLAITLLKQGVRSDIPVGYHPSRQWCDNERHIDSYKTPIHECAESGQLNVLRAFVSYSLYSIVVKDGNGKTAFQLALRNKKKPCAGFLLAKQWSRIQYGHSDYTMPLNLYASIKDWCERAKDKVFTVYGQSKSSLKRRPFIAASGTLVGLDVSVDGFGDKRMNGKPVFCPSPNTVERRTRSYLILPQDKNKNPDMYFKEAQRSLSHSNMLLKKKPSVKNFGRVKTDSEDSSHASRPPSANDHKPGTQSQLSHAIDVDQNNNDASRNTKSSKNSRPAVILEENGEEKDSENSTFKTADNDTNVSPKSSKSKRKVKRKNGPNVVDRPPPKDAIFSSLVGGGGGSSLLRSDNTLDGGVKLPRLSRTPNMTTQSHPDLSSVGKGTYLQTGQSNEENSKNERSRTLSDSQGQNKTQVKNKKSVTKALQLAQASQGEGDVQLPVMSLENKTRPYFHHVRSASDPAISTLTLYEKYRGLQARDYAIKCLSIASNFKDKPWLQQVRLAMTLTAQGVKKVVRNNVDTFKRRDES